MNGWKLWTAEWRSIFKNPRVLVPILAVALVPLMYAGMFLWAFWDPYGQMKDLPVAIVNEDKGATFEGESLEIGDDLIDKLLKSEAFEFVETTEKEAESGLEDHDYYMAIEIPEDFSEKATTALDEDPEQLELKYIANESYNFLAAQIGGSAMEQVKAELSTEVSKQYVSALKDGLNDVADGLGEAADGATKLAEGSKTAKDGAVKLADGTELLASKQRELADGASQLNDGIAQLADGSSELADGTKLLASKQRELADGASQLNDGVTQLVDGSSELADGSQQVHEGSASLSDGVHRVSDGASALQDGTSQLVEGTGTFASKLDELHTGAKTLNQGVQDLSAGIERSKEGASALNDGANQLAGALTTAKDGNAALVVGQTELVNGIGQMKSELTAKQDELIGQLTTLAESGQSASPEMLQAIAAQLSDGKQETAAGFDQLAAGATKVKDGQTSLAAGLEQAEAGAGELSLGLSELSTGQTKLVEGAKALASGSSQIEQGTQTAAGRSQELVAASSKLNQGATQLQDGTNELVTGSDKLVAATGQLSEGSVKLADGAKSASAGTSELANGANQLADGGQKLQSGSRELADGAQDAGAGTSELANGASQLADGGQELQSGSGELADGMTDLASGNDELRDALLKGAEDADIGLTDNNVEMMAGPVALVDNSIHEVPNYGTGFAPYFMSLGLFVGALLLSIVYPLYDPVGRPKRSLSWVMSKSGVLVVVGFLQALILDVAMVQLLGLEVSEPLKFFGFSWLTSITFLFIVQLLVTTLGNPGRFVAIVLLILQLTTSAGTFPLELIPRALQPFNALLPMTYTVAGYKEILSADGAQYLQTATIYLTFVAAGCFALLWAYFRIAWKKKYRPIASEA
ncbi:YhgE/Pip domain-containing protein [Exiguobacterium marinum]|uniref:YhgE/Pip domain-containing protein n=1 Tax=Exiguobacterium marinum TaxID=273528 RepID=A0ABY7X195_9BACL|nr:YhgE/Pip domain-containing protein [Exiguobacterium marinum]WDH75884.1 YhgE/Pip domain-containing protein [Exiguobacterium marinum]